MKELKGSWLVTMIVIIVGLIYLYQADLVSENIKKLMWVIPLSVYCGWNLMVCIYGFIVYGEFKEVGDIDIQKFIKSYLDANFILKITITYWLILSIFIVKIWLDNNLTIKFTKDEN